MVQRPSFRNTLACTFLQLEDNYDAIVDKVMSFDPPVLNPEFPRLQSNYKCMAALARLVVDCVYSGALSRNDAEQILSTLDIGYSGIGP